MKQTTTTRRYLVIEQDVPSNNIELAYALAEQEGCAGVKFLPNGTNMDGIREQTVRAYFPIANRGKFAIPDGCYIYKASAWDVKRMGLRA
jgi:hypothetical protein